MRYRLGSGILLAALACLAVAEPTDAYAYLDPGAGSFLMQGIIAGIAGGVLAIRGYWAKIVGLFIKSKTSSEIEPDHSSGPH